MPRRLVGTTLAAIALLGNAVPAHADTKDECINLAEAGQHLKTQRKLAGAREKLVACARDACPAVVREDCIKWLAEVDASVPTIVVRARDDAGHDVLDVRVLVDGVELVPRLSGTAVQVDPGEHRFRFEPAGRPAVEETLLIAESEKGRIVHVELHGDTKGVHEPPNPATADGGGPPHEPSGTSSSSSGSVVPWIVGGVGAASLVAFGVLEAVLQGEYRDLQNGCGATKSCTGADVSPTQTKITLAEIALGVGIAGVAVAIPWILIDRSHAHDPAGTAYLGVHPTQGGAVGTLGGRF